MLISKGARKTLACLCQSLLGFCEAWWVARDISTKTWPHPISCRLQYRDHSGQTEIKVRTVSPIGQLPKDFLSPQSPQDIPLDMALPTRSYSIHQWEVTNPSHRNSAQASKPDSTTRGQKPEVRNNSPIICRTEFANRSEPTLGPELVPHHLMTQRTSPKEGDFSKV